MSTTTWSLPKPPKTGVISSNPIEMALEIGFKLFGFSPQKRSGLVISTLLNFHWVGMGSQRLHHKVWPFSILHALFQHFDQWFRLGGKAKTSWRGKMGSNGDRFRPQFLGLWDPNGHFCWHVNGSYILTYILPGMILLPQPLDSRWSKDPLNNPLIRPSYSWGKPRIWGGGMS